MPDLNFSPPSFPLPRRPPAKTPKVPGASSSWFTDGGSWQRPYPFRPPSGGSLRAVELLACPSTSHISPVPGGGGGPGSLRSQPQRPRLCQAWRLLPPHHSPLAHGAPGGAPAGLGSFTGGSNAGGSWVAVLGSHPAGAEKGDRNSDYTETAAATAGSRALPPAFEL